MYNITLELVKKHLNIDEEFKDDDEYLMMLVDVAIVAVEKHIDHSLSDLQEDGDLPSPILQAILLFVGDMYQSRESVAFTNAVEIPNGYQYLLSLYKDYSKREVNGGVF